MSDADFKRWYERNAVRSEVTAQEFARVLDRYSRLHDLTPMELVRLARRKRKAIEDQLDDFIIKLHKEGKNGGYIANYLKAVKSWLQHHDIELRRRFRIPYRDSRSTLSDEVVPTRESLRATLNAATLRGRVVVALMSLAGLRPGTLGNFHGADGLKVRDLPEMSVRNGKVSFSKIPTVVVVRPELNKAQHRYITFLPEEGTNYLAGYIEARLAAGEGIGPDSPVIAVDARAAENELRNGKAPGHIATKNVTDDVRDAMRSAGVMSRPYTWRSYFDTNLLIAESQGRLPPHFRIAWMGHKKSLGMEGPYTTLKQRLPEKLIEEMREKFRDASALLVTSGPPVDPRVAELVARGPEIERLLGIQKDVEDGVRRLFDQLTPEDEETLSHLVAPRGSLPAKAEAYGQLVKRTIAATLLEDSFKKLLAKSR